MIGFFPAPYPDEILYSTCARYAGRVKYPNKQSSSIELLGNRGFSAIVDFPSRLKYFVSILPPGNHYSVEQLINENTLLPFYEPFLPSDRAELVRREMKENLKDNNLRSRLGTTVKQIRKPECLRFCPVCVEENRGEYSETYWHRLHQLPGVLVCPVHLCFLENSSVKWQRGIGSQFYSAEEHISRKKPRLLDSADADHQILLKLAENAKWLLSQNHISIGNDFIRDRYYNQLLERGLAYYNGRTRNSKLLKAFQDYYSPSLLNLLGCPVESGQRSWIFRLVEKCKADILHHPVRHLLMMTFLGMTAEKFLTSFVQYKPFADAPYPCLNRAADHYGELRIQQCEVFDNLTKGNRRGKPIAVFTCDCGFIYQRIGPDTSGEDRFRYDSVREYGNVWEGKIREMWNDPSLSRAEIARRLGISDILVTNTAYRLDFPMNTPGTRISNDKTHCQAPRRTLSESRAIYRRKWLVVLNESPTANRDKLIKLANFEYLWLMRNDAEWIHSHLPEILKLPRKKELLDWRQIDDELSVKVEKVCQEIVSAEPLKRVSITEIIKRVGYKQWIEKRHLRLPETTRIIDERLESLEDFMIRKLNLTESQFIKDKVAPTRHQLIRRAVIENQTMKNSKRIQDEITMSLKKMELLF